MLIPSLPPYTLTSVAHVRRYSNGSDLDLLVDALPGPTLFDLGGLQDEIETLLGVHTRLARSFLSRVK